MQAAKLIRHMLRRAANDNGATAIEYSMIACFVFLAIVGAVTALGQGVVDTLYNKIEPLF
jgi:Flp pilus assembly pilin Flp